MRVNFGCLLRSALSLISRGSNAILWPFSEFSYAVSGVRSSLRFGAGELTRLPSSSPLPTPPPPPLLRVSPELEAIACGRGTSGVVPGGIYWRRCSTSTGMQALGLRIRGERSKTGLRGQKQCQKVCSSRKRTVRGISRVACTSVSWRRASCDNYQRKGMFGHAKPRPSPLPIAHGLCTSSPILIRTIENWIGYVYREGTRCPRLFYIQGDI
jgi:hypothetical protein